MILFCFDFVFAVKTNFPLAGIITSGIFPEFIRSYSIRGISGYIIIFLVKIEKHGFPDLNLMENSSKVK